MKEKLFEMMEKLNPSSVSGEKKKPKDVVLLKRKFGEFVADDLKKIDSPHEFRKAFKVWFSFLGYEPGKISKTRILRDVREMLEELGYE